MRLIVICQMLRQYRSVLTYTQKHFFYQKMLDCNPFSILLRLFPCRPSMLNKPWTIAIGIFMSNRLIDVLSQCISEFSTKKVYVHACIYNFY